MPIFDHRFVDEQNNPQPQALSVAGAILPVHVSVPLALEDFLRAKNQEIPSPTKGIALIDTGASKSCVDHSVLVNLGIKSIGVVKIGTAKGATLCQLFPSRLIFPTLRLRVNFSSMAGVHLRGQVIHDEPLIALVGRDILSRCLFIYSGYQGYYTLTY